MKLKLMLEVGWYRKEIVEVGVKRMNEFLVSFELWTILYILILVPSCTFLIVFAYRIAKSLEMGLLERWNRRLVNQNKKVIMENIKASNELIDIQYQLRKELELTKKELQE